MTPEHHSECRPYLQGRADAIEDMAGGAQVEITAADPGDPEVDSIRCPHGARYWIVPVGGGS